MDRLDLIVNRADLAQTEVVQTPVAPPEPGQCVLRIDRFALTANNITYAVAPDLLQYWQFFPVARDGWGMVPVWGFAEVVASAHPQVANGTRVYGYFPMSTHLTIDPVQVNANSMMDGAAHRQPMSPIYNQYTFTTQDPAWSPETEGLISLYRPLFTTSFLINTLHRRNDMFGAARVILSAASSKTAMALAFLLSQGGGVEVVGLTSAGNADFVAGLGCYDTVVAYEDLETIAPGPAAYVDMAGNVSLLRRVHDHFRDDLKNSCRVGLAHWQATEGETDGLPGPKAEFFFAPAYAQQLVRDWGPGDFFRRSAAAWADFIDTGAAWVQVVEETGADIVQRRWTDTLAGKVEPSKGLFLSMHG